ncbi:hypothetical protein DFQ30_008254 [Apophysomyces sp. BC1015]|nr:hypothetical protein DFQ30_008254 [Apophysomyces sp. BC1015]KAG0178363.1 hypothetical protein DFQ29_003567 [Apophysomyces sp. BC1021]
MDPSSAAVAAAVGGVGQPSFFMNLQSSSPDSTSSSGLLPPPTTASILSSLHPFSMASPSPTVDLHHLQQHRHSIAAPSSHHLNSYYDPVQRHHSFSHPTNMFNSTQQGEARGTASPATTMIQSFANLCTSRPVTPVSPLMPLSPGMNTGLSKEDCHGLMNDLCFPPVFAMSPHNGMADLRRRSLPTESKAEKTKSTRSRGRRVSNVPSNGARMFTCKVDGCGKVFKRSEHLKRHIRSIHTLEKPFECPYQSCNKRFSRSDNLNQHIRIHRHSTASASHKEKQPKSNGASSAVAEHPQQQFASFVQNYNV